MSRDSRTLAESFLAQHPDFDLLHFDFHRPGATDALDFGALDRDSAIEDLKAFQRMLRLHPSESVATALFGAGFRSAHEIAARSEKQFVREFAGVFESHNGGRRGQSAARSVHRAAADVVERVRLMGMNLLALSDPRSSASPALKPPPAHINFYQGFPGYEDLFGSLNYLQCEECQSIWSPAAYFVDLMRLVGSHISKPPNQELWLSRRRPDLWEIPLDCEATNQEVPYLQIVNRILEAQVRYRIEHGEKYEGASVQSFDPLLYLAVCDYPFALPFNEPLVRIRELLQHFDLTLAEVYEAFRVGKAPDDVPGSIAREVLDLSPEKYALLTTPASKSGTGALQRSYGLQTSNNLSNLSDVDTFLALTKLGFKQLEGLLNQNLRRKRTLRFADSFAVNVPLDHVNANLLTEDQTVEMWLYPFYFANLSQPLNDDNQEFQVTIDTQGNVTYGWSDTSDDLQTISLGPLKSIEWAHVAFVRDLKAQKNYAYLNGNLFGWNSINSSVAAPTSKPLIIGANYSGAIVDLRVWATARSAEQIKANFQRRLSGHEDGLVGCWPLDDGVGTTIRDISPYKNYGTIENVAGTGTPPLPQWPVAIDLVWDSNEIQGAILGQFFINQALLTTNTQNGDPVAQFLMIGEIPVSNKYTASLCVVNMSADNRTMIPLNGTPYEAATLDRLNRFIRLAENLGWSFADLDLALRSIEPPALTPRSATEIDEKAIKGLAAIKKLQSKLGLQVDEVCALWSDMNTFGIGNDGAPQDLFDRTFNSPTSFVDPTGQFLAPPYHPSYRPNPLYFDPPLFWNIDDHRSPQNQMIRARLRGSLALDDLSLGLLIDFLREKISGLRIEVTGNYLSVTLLTLLYRYAKLAQSLNLRMDQFLTLLRLLNKPHIKSIATVSEIVEWAEWLSASGLTIAQLEYLTTGKTNPWVDPGYNPDAVTSLVQSLFQAATPVLVTPASFLSPSTDASNSSNTPGMNTTQATAVYQALQGASFIDANGVVLNQPLTRPAILSALETAPEFSSVPFTDYHPLVTFVIEVVFGSQAKQRYLVQQHLAAFFGVSPELMAGATMLTARTLPSYLNLGGTASVSLPKSPMINPPAFTSCCWVKASAPTKEKNFLFYAMSADRVSGYAISLYEAAERLAFQIEIGNGPDPVVYYAHTPLTGSWSHVALTCDGQAVSLYVNGVSLTLEQKNNSPLGTFSPNLTAPIYVGSNGTAEYLNGSVSQLRIYNRALSGEQLADVMYRTGGRFEVSDANLVGYWPLDAGGGLEAYDATSYCNTGTVNTVKNAAPNWTNYDPGSLLFNLPDDEAVPANVDELISAHAQSFCLASQFNLDPVAMASLAERPAAFGINGFGFGFHFSLDDLRSINLYQRLMAAFDTSAGQLLDYFRLASEETEPRRAQEKLAHITGWPIHQIAILEEQPFWPKDCAFDTVDQVAALKQCFDQADALGSDIGLMLSLRRLNTLNLGAPGAQPSQPDWDIYQTTAHNLSQAINSKYGANIAPQVLSSILGKLEELKRDVLVDFLLWELSFIIDGLKTSDDLYDFLLIDVDMSSVVQISPLKAGLNSLQLYVQSTQMDLEAGAHNEIPRLWWSWMQNYRVWQANREVFLYPENYVDPALRRFKTPQFKQLETSLQQGSVTPEMADSALTNYLEGMATVANLKIISSYRAQVKKSGVNPGETEEIDTVFIFGRTRTDPATFYFRTLRITDKSNPEKGIWSPWQQINLSINAEEITPIYAFEKLYIFWVEQSQKTVNITKPSQESVQITTASIYYSFQKLDRSWVATQTLEKDLVIGANPCTGLTTSVGLLQKQLQTFHSSKNPLPTQPDLSVWKKVRVMYLPSSGSQGQILILYGDYVASSASWPSSSPGATGNAEIDTYLHMLHEAIEVKQPLNSQGQGNLTTIVPAWVGGASQTWERTTIQVNPAVANYCNGYIAGAGGAQVNYFETNDLLFDQNLFRLLVAYYPLTDSVSEIRDLISGGTPQLSGIYEWATPNNGPFTSRKVLQCSASSASIVDISIPDIPGSFTLMFWMTLTANTIPSGSWYQFWVMWLLSEQFIALNATSNAVSLTLDKPLSLDMNTWTQVSFQYSWDLATATFTAWNNQTLSTNLPPNRANLSSMTIWPTPSVINPPSGTEFTGQLANISVWNATINADKTSLPVSLALDGFPLLKAGVSPLTSRIEPVGNQPGWFTFDNGDEAFLVVPQGDPFFQLESITTAKLSPAPGTGPRAKLPVLSLSFGDAAIDPTTFNFTSLELQFIRLTTAVVQNFEQKLLIGGPEMLLTLASQYTDELPFSRYKPIANVAMPQPSARLDFNGSFGEYFWELFFYAPFLIADTFANNQRFQLAQKWLQYSFDPTPMGVVQQLGYWPMDYGAGATLYDQVGLNNGTIAPMDDGGVIEPSWTTDPSCPLGADRWLVSLNATDYVQIDGIKLTDPNGPMTLSFWVKATSAASEWQNILYYAPSPTATFVVGMGFGATPSLTSEILWFWSSASGATWYSGPTLSPGWNHVVVMLKNACGPEPGDVYVNGLKSAFTSGSTPNSFTVSLPAAQMLIGWDSAQYPPIVGMITDLQIWDVALSEETIQQIETRKPTQADRFWRFRPFLNQTPESLKAELNNPQQLAVYEWDPFDPDALARLRGGAYEKGIVMRYVENLIKWGNKLFAQYTWETITEASMFYTEALNLLGPQPRQVGDFPAPPIKTVLDFVKEYGGAQEIPEFLVQLEHDVTSPSSNSGNKLSGKPFNVLNSYFCVPVNKRLLAMWQEADNQLYKIRHGENIKGQPQPLPLFEPPLAPGKLVKAGARGLVGASRPAAGAPNIPYYRFSYLIQQAKDVTSQVIQLGSSLLGALERQDGEQLALIQNSNEAAILNLTTEIKQNQIDQLEQSAQGLAASLAAAQLRLQTYNSWLDGGGWTDSLSTAERISLLLLEAAAGAHAIAAEIRVLASPLYLLPTVFGAADGGMDPGKSVEAMAGSSDSIGGVLAITSQLAGSVAQFQRRDQEWQLQSELAADDITQIQAQIAANQTMIVSAQRDLQIHQEQITQNQGIGNFYRTKFTSEQLYQWMAGRLSTIYFQSYQLAFELAQDAQMAFQYENNSVRNYLNYNAWDNLEKGLTAGDSLMLSLDQLEKANIDAGVRHLEIEKTISLVQLNPQALLNLKSTGTCSFGLTEQLFDYDFPGHYNRKIKTVSITIPAIVGPYQNIHASLTQTASRVVTEPDIQAVKYLLPGGQQSGPSPAAIRSNWNVNQEVALSRGSNDSGLFVLNFDDPRYLPFEGTGAISNWTLDMYKAANAIDFNTISDVIIQLSYTAQDGGEAFRQSVTQQKAVANYFGYRYLSLRQAFPEAWHNFIHPTSGNPTIRFPITQTMFPPNLAPNSINLGTPADKNGKPSVGTIAVEWLTADGDASGLPSLTLNNQSMSFEPSHPEILFTQLAAPGTKGPVTSQPGLDEFGISNPNVLTALGPITKKMEVIDIVLIIPFDGTLNWPASKS